MLRDERGRIAVGNAPNGTMDNAPGGTSTSRFPANKGEAGSMSNRRSVRWSSTMALVLERSRPEAPGDRASCWLTRLASASISARGASVKTLTSRSDRPTDSCARHQARIEQHALIIEERLNLGDTQRARPKECRVSRIGGVEPSLYVADLNVERACLVDERERARRVRVHPQRHLQLGQPCTPPFTHTLPLIRKARRHPHTRVELALADPIEQPSRRACSLSINARSRALVSPRSARRMLMSIARSYARRKPAKTKCTDLRADRRLTEPFRELDDATRFGVGSFEVTAFHRGVSQPGPCLRFALRQPPRHGNFTHRRKSGNGLIELPVFEVQATEALLRNAAKMLRTTLQRQRGGLVPRTCAFTIATRQPHVGQPEPRQRLLISLNGPTSRFEPRLKEGLSFVELAPVQIVDPSHIMMTFVADAFPAASLSPCVFRAIAASKSPASESRRARSQRARASSGRSGIAAASCWARTACSRAIA